jgi:hypothetical protein
MEALEYDYVGLGVGKPSGAASGRSSPVPVGSPASKGSDFFSIQRAGSTVNFLQEQIERASARARESRARVAPRTERALRRESRWESARTSSRLHALGALSLSLSQTPKPYATLTGLQQSDAPRQQDRQEWEDISVHR